MKSLSDANVIAEDARLLALPKVRANIVPMLKYLKFDSFILRSFSKRGRDRVFNTIKDYVKVRKTFLETLK